MASTADGLGEQTRPRRLPVLKAQWYWHTASWAACFVLLTALIQVRTLSSLDEAGLGLVAATRPDWALGAMNWIFRAGFVQVDVAVAALWSTFLLWRTLRSKRDASVASVSALLRPFLPAFSPLLIVSLVGVQAGLRLVIDQPAPPPAFAVHRPFATQPVADVLDRTDAVARQGFLQATSPSVEKPTERGSYPSGHSSRMLFLGGLALSYQLSATRRRHGTRMDRRPRASARQAGSVLVATTTVALVSYSAMYFGYHWPTDILGGLLLAMAFLPLADRLTGLSTS